jgi:large subunit ribosomal protein L32
MAVPQKQSSKAVKRQRYSTFQKLSQKKLLERTNLMTCSKCGAKKRMHFACPECGDYRGRQALVIAPKGPKIKKVQA